MKGDLITEPPNGGFKAWRAVLGSFLLETSSFGFVSACGVFQLYYRDILLPDASSQQLGWITTVAVFLIFGVGIPIGALVDQYGCRPVVAPFAALGVLSLGLLSLCTEYWQVLLCQGVLFGLACSGTTLPAVVCVTQWFSTRRGLAVGIASSGTSLGGLMYPIMAARLIKSHGFPTAIRWCTLTVGIGMAVGVYCLEDPFPCKRARNHIRDQQESESASQIMSEVIAPTNFSPSDNEMVSSVASRRVSRPGESIPVGSTQTVVVASGSTSMNKGGTTAPGLFKSLRHNGGAWLAFIGGAFMFMTCSLAPYNYLPEMAAQSGMNTDLAQYTVAVVNAGSLLGRILPGWLSDYLGQFNVMVMVSASSAIAVLAMWLPLDFCPNEGGLFAFAFLFGFFSGGYTSLLSPCIVAIVDGRVQDLGLKFGLGCLILAFGALLGLPSLGAIIDSTGNFTGLIAASGVAMAIGSLLFGVARVKMGGWKVMQKV